MQRGEQGGVGSPGVMPWPDGAGGAWTDRAPQPLVPDEDTRPSAGRGVGVPMSLNSQGGAGQEQNRVPRCLAQRARGEAFPRRMQPAALYQSPVAS